MFLFISLDCPFVFLPNLSSYLRSTQDVNILQFIDSLLKCYSSNSITVFTSSPSMSSFVPHCPPPPCCPLLSLSLSLSPFLSLSLSLSPSFYHPGSVEELPRMLLVKSLVILFLVIPPLFLSVPHPLCPPPPLSLSLSLSLSLAPFLLMIYCRY